MKTLMFALSVVLAATTFAAEAKAPLTEAEKAARKAAAQKLFEEKTGGWILKPGTQAGKVVYVNCQKRAERAWIDESVAYFTKESKLKIDVVDGSFDLKNPKVEGNVSLFIVDDEALPPLLVAPENRWTMVNVAPLAKDAKPAFFRARVLKELTRGFAYLCGAANSQYPMALTGGVTKTADLDNYMDHRLPVDVLARFEPSLKPFGVAPAVYQTYRNACKAGWAPAPTNDNQRAVAKLIAAEKAETLKGPSKPRKIEFDAKKGE